MRFLYDDPYTMRSGSNLRRFASMVGFGAFDVSKLIKFYVKDALNEKTQCCSE